MIIRKYSYVNMCCAIAVVFVLCSVLRGQSEPNFIPEGVVHSATFLTRVQVIDVFDAPDRYQPRP